MTIKFWNPRRHQECPICGSLHPKYVREFTRTFEGKPVTVKVYRCSNPQCDILWQASVKP